MASASTFRTCARNFSIYLTISYYSDSLKVTDNMLAGTLPSEVGELTMLTELDIQNNGFTGPLPAQLADLSSIGKCLLNRTVAIDGPLIIWSYIVSFNIAENQLTGEVPAEFGKLFTISTYTAPESAQYDVHSYL